MFEAIAVLFTAFIFIAIFLLGIGIILHILLGFALLHLAEREGVPNGWLGFVPLANLYIMGAIAQKQSKASWKEYVPWALPGIVAASFVLGFLPLIGELILIATPVVYGYILYLIFERYSSQAVLFLVLSFISFGFLAPIFIFIIRNNEPLTQKDINQMNRA